MQDLHEKMRRYHEHMVARSERSMRYWDQVPPFRITQELLNCTEKLVEALTQGGSVPDAAMNLGFLCFLLTQKGAEIQEVTSRMTKAKATETTVEEHDPEREEWERKQREKKGGEDWRG